MLFWIEQNQWKGYRFAFKCVSCKPIAIKVSVHNKIAANFHFYCNPFTYFLFISFSDFHHSNPYQLHCISLYFTTFIDVIDLVLCGCVTINREKRRTIFIYGRFLVVQWLIWLSYNHKSLQWDSSHQILNKNVIAVGKWRR